jgi:hypothetical protein
MRYQPHSRLRRQQFFCPAPCSFGEKAQYFAIFNHINGIFNGPPVGAVSFDRESFYFSYEVAKHRDVKEFVLGHKVYFLRPGDTAYQWRVQPGNMVGADYKRTALRQIFPALYFPAADKAEILPEYPADNSIEHCSFPQLYYSPTRLIIEVITCSIVISVVSI